MGPSAAGDETVDRVVAAARTCPDEVVIPAPTVGTGPAAESFFHSALLHAGPAELLAATTRFVHEGLAAGDAVLVLMGGSKIDALRAALGPVGSRARFTDTDEVGANPARLIPLWREFCDSLEPGRRARGVGEPLSADRGPAEIAECEIHESLLNVAFDGPPPLWLLCPYDTTILSPDLIDEAHCSHPFVVRGPDGPITVNHRFPGVGVPSARAHEPLPAVPAEAVRIAVTVDTVGRARHRLYDVVTGSLGATEPAAADFTLAAHEVIANSLRHGGGRAEVAVWREGDTLLGQVADEGRITDPLAGRRRPSDHDPSGRGLWMANQLCDLVQIRSLASGTVVRLHVGRHRA
jgi:anti-sigma regulatory factor (Ser/Thr protein kinase)